MRLRGRWIGLALSLATATLGVAPLGCGGASPGWAVVQVPDGDLAGEEARLERDLQARGGSASTYARLSAVKLRQGQPVAAGAFARRALAMDGAHAGALVVSARVAAATGDAGRAAALYERAVEVEPGLAGPVGKEWGDALVALARTRAEAGRAAGVVELLGTLEARLPERAAALRAVRAGLYLAAAEAWVQQGQGAEAGRALARARAAGADPDAMAFVEACTRVLGGEAGEAGGGLDEAKRAFERWASGREATSRWTRVGELFAARPLHDEARWALGKAEPARAASAAEALRVARLALRVDAPEVAVKAVFAAADLAERAGGASARAGTLREGAELLRRSGRQAEAIEAFEAAVAAAPGDRAVARDYADYLEQQGKYQPLGELALRHVPLVADDPEAVAELTHRLLKDPMASRAVEVLGRLAEAPGAPPQVLVDLAMARHRAGDAGGRDAAMARFEQGAGDAPEALVLAGRTWWRFSELGRARKLAERAVALAPTRPEPALLMADLHRAAGDARREASALQQLLDRSPEPALAALHVGRRYAELTREGKDPEGRLALMHLGQAASASDPAIRRQAHRELFELSMRRPISNFPAAGDHMRAWLELTPEAERPAALELLAARTAGIAGLTDLRAEVLEASLEARPEDAAIAEELGRLYLQLGHRAKAREAFERVVRINGASAAERFGEAFLSRGYEDEALAFFAMVDPDRVTQPATHRTLGELFARRGDGVRANRHFRLFIAQVGLGGGRNLRDLRSFGEQMLAAHRPELAIEAFELIREQHPQDRPILLLLGRAHLQARDLPRAREVLDAWLGHGGRNGSVRIRDLDAVAALYHDQGAWADAAKAWESAIALDRPAYNSKYFNALSAIRRKTGDREGLMRAARVFVSRAQSKDRATDTAARQLHLAGMLTEARDLIRARLPEWVDAGEPPTRTSGRMGDSSLLASTAAENALLRRAPAEALRYLRATLALRGLQRDEGLATAQLLLSHGLPAEAEQLLAELIDGAPWVARIAGGFAPGPELYEARGRVRLMRGDREGAREDFVAALVRSPSPSEVAERTAKHLRVARQPEMALDLLTRAANAGGRVDHWLAIGALHAGRGDLDEARLAFGRLLATHERSHLEVAQAWAEAGYVADALHHYERAYEHVGPDAVDAVLRGAAALLVPAGRLEALDEHVRRYLLAARDAGAAFVQVASVWLDAGRPERALPWVERALEVKPDLERRLQMALLLLEVGREAEGRRELARYLAQRADDHASRVGGRGPGASTSADEAIDRVLGRMVDAGRAPLLLDVLHDVRRRVGPIPAYLGAEARLLVLQGQVAEAMALVGEQGERLSHLRPAQLGALIVALADRDRVDEALEVSRLAARWKTPRRPSDEVRGLAGVRVLLEARRGDVEAAERAADELVTAFGPGAHVIAATALYDEGLPELAARHVDEALARGNEREAVEPALIGLAAARARRGTMGALRELTEGLVRRASSQPDQVDGALNAARIHLAVGAFERAAEAAERGLALEPSNATLMETLVQAVALGAPRGAETLPEPLAALLARFADPGRPRAQLVRELMGLLGGMFRPRLALSLADEVLALDRGDVDAAFGALELALQAGDVARAERLAAGIAEWGGGGLALEIELAERLDERVYPELATPWLARTSGARGPLAARRQRVLLRQALRAGDDEAAKAAAQTWVEQAPDPVTARLEAAALVETWMGPPGLTSQLVTPLLDGAERPPDALHLAAQAAWRAGDVARARAHYAASRAQPIESLLQPAAARAARAAALAGDVERFAAILAEPAPPRGLLAGTLATEGASARLTHAQQRASVGVHALMDVGDAVAPEVRASLAEVVEAHVVATTGSMHPSHGWLTSAWWALAMARGDAEAGIAAYEAAMARRPWAPWPANDLAYNLAVVGQQLDRAAGLIATARRRSPKLMGSFEDTAGWVAFRQGRHAEALAAVERGLRLTGRDGRRYDDPGMYVELLFHAGEAAAAAGDAAAARAWFRDCAWRDPGSRYGVLCLQRVREGGRR